MIVDALEGRRSNAGAPAPARAAGRLRSCSMGGAALDQGKSKMAGMRPVQRAYVQVPCAIRAAPLSATHLSSLSASPLLLLPTAPP